mmetsp:Transcript_75596/g.133417  ORF Transcript_75596/g.133417 Transcript_75596/m.133417 type:complete len:141 (-) Transcript_75596:224-646(-)
MIVQACVCPMLPNGKSNTQKKADNVERGHEGDCVLCFIMLERLPLGYIFAPLNPVLWNFCSTDQNVWILDPGIEVPAQAGGKSKEDDEDLKPEIENAACTSHRSAQGIHKERDQLAFFLEESLAFTFTCTFRPAILKKFR